MYKFVKVNNQLQIKKRGLSYLEIIRPSKFKVSVV